MVKTELDAEAEWWKQVMGNFENPDGTQPFFDEALDVDDSLK